MNQTARFIPLSTKLLPLNQAIALGFTVLGSIACQADTLTLDPLVVSASRMEQNSFDVPVSIDVISNTQIQNGGFNANVGDTLTRIPGIVAPNQSRFSSDQQVSSRGFGARSAFGIRGVRVYADGISLSMPDGQGQMGSINLSSADRLEVMRGPFSALYGNSSGGVIQAFTKDAPPTPSLSASYQAGSFSTSRFGMQAGGQHDALNYMLDASRYQTDGYRDHSAARRDHLNAKFSYRPDDQTRIAVVFNSLEQPYNQDPQGLTRAQMQTDPKQANTTSSTFNTGGSKAQNHVGANLEYRLDAANTVILATHAGQRDVLGRLGISGSGALSSGGISDVSRSFAGMDARWRHKLTTNFGPLTITGGLNYEHMRDERKGYVNINGVQGDLRRDEDNIVSNFDQYLQMEWQLGKNWVVNGGVRHSRVDFEVRDRYITGANPDDSGNISYSNTSPVFGVLYHLSSTVNVYANFGKGFETPTFIELTYRPVGSGLNFGLLPSKAQNVEAGVKAFIGDQSRLNLAFFDISTENEIVIGTSVGGRNTYRNAGRTKRKGIEMSLDSNLGENIGLYLSYALLDTRFEDAFLAGSGTGTVMAGNRIPGAPRISAFGELNWRLPTWGFTTAIEARYSSKIYVDDLNSDAADSFSVLNWRADLEQRTGGWTFKEYLRIENLTDKSYVGGVLVNDSNGRFFAPAPGRNYVAGVSVSTGF